jgi:hypothetical protein
MIRRAFLPLVGLACGLGLLLASYRMVLFADEQFAFRDTCHFYYPLHLRVQQEWNAGRWPLWDPGQNGGMPLLGYPMGAVLYPGKVVYAVLPFPWAHRLYVVGHTVVAGAGMWLLARSLGISGVGASLAALSYAFGAPVLFQSCNVIYLVGAAWLPWGFGALDRLVRLRRRGGAIALALVLALETLGGDPEAAYLTVVSGAGYAVVVALGIADWPARLPPLLRSGRFRRWALLAAGLIWIGLVLGVSSPWARRARPDWLPGWERMRMLVQALGWGVVVLSLLWSWARPRSREAERRRAVLVLVPTLAGLVGAGVLALALTGAQLLPILEFSRHSDRAVMEQPLSVFDFGLEPYRLVELVWPNVFGTLAPENRWWLQAIPPSGQHQSWTLSLYVGCLTIALAFASHTGGGDEPPWRTWLVLVALVSLAASCGRHGGPLWWARWFPAGARVFGPHDPHNDFFRPDAFPEDGSGSPYGVLAELLPGFAVFRYPGKLLTFTTLAVAVLGGRGWDLLVSGRARGPARGCGWGLAVTLLVLALAVVIPQRALAALLTARTLPDPQFGPLDIPAALNAIRRGLIHGAVALGLVQGLTWLVPRRPRLAGGAALILLSLDLGLANAGLIWTIPQAVFDAPSEVARQIEIHERRNASASPASAPASSPDLFRIHRLPDWRPNEFARRRSPGRLRELIAWERDTLEPLFGLPRGVPYGLVQGNLEVLEHLICFRATMLPVYGTLAARLGVADGRPVLYIPRRAFDLWNARYFIVPHNTDGFDTRERGFASLLPQSELIYPAHAELATRGPGSWSERADWMLLKNNTAFPRAWLVHLARVRKPVSIPRLRDQPDDERLGLLQEILYGADAFWNDPTRPLFDLRAMAFIETDDPARLSGFISPTPVAPGESVTITKYQSQRVELTAVLKHPGLVILADTFYPGWHLKIDGAESPIYRTNHAMRGAAVGAGTHHLVYSYEPDSFRSGLWLSLAGAVALAGLVAWTALDRRRPASASASAPASASASSRPHR